jgi:ABC-type ATPase with predicted acetyltransferase domain
MLETNRVAEPRPRFSLLDRMYVERGTKDDWELLHELHYKAEGAPAGARYWRCALDGETIGVIVTGSPKGLLKERHKAFPQLKPDGKDTKITNTYRYKWINANMRVISRFVVDTMFRGVGVAYRFQNIASRMEGNTFMEIQSSMSKYNLFAQKAGFRFVKPSNSNKWEVGLKFMRQTFDANPADHEAIMTELNCLPPAVRERVIAKTRDFYYRHSALEKTGNNRDKGTSRVEAMEPGLLIKQLQQMVLASPMYGVYRNPDRGRDLPERIPMTAFENQAVSEPLKLECLE